MRDIDMELSEKVAEKASAEINDLRKELEKSKDLKLSILQDVLGDVRDQRGFFKKLCVILCSFVFITIAGIVTISISNQKILAESNYRSVERILDFLEKANVNIDTSEITKYSD